MYVFKMARLLGLLLFLLTSQTKPGPNMASAVAINVLRSDSTDENDAFIRSVRAEGI